MREYAFSPSVSQKSVESVPSSSDSTALHPPCAVQSMPSEPNLPLMDSHPAPDFSSPRHLHALTGPDWHGACPPERFGAEDVPASRDIAPTLPPLDLALRKSRFDSSPSLPPLNLRSLIAVVSITANNQTSSESCLRHSALAERYPTHSWLHGPEENSSDRLKSDSPSTMRLSSDVTQIHHPAYDSPTPNSTGHSLPSLSATSSSSRPVQLSYRSPYDSTHASLERNIPHTRDEMPQTGTHRPHGGRTAVETATANEGETAFQSIHHHGNTAASNDTMSGTSDIAGMLLFTVLVGVCRLSFRLSRQPIRDAGCHSFLLYDNTDATHHSPRDSDSDTVLSARHTCGSCHVEREPTSSAAIALPVRLLLHGLLSSRRSKC